MTWLTNEWYLLGIPIQNWMWVFAACLLVYALALTFAHMRHTRAD
jgi:disulfide bond formation protein DsbB